MDVELITWSEIENIWKTHLWQGRISDIEEMSAMLYKDGLNENIFRKYTPTFFGVFIDDDLVGVNSGHISEKDYYRSRGLFVFSEHRGKGIAQALLTATSEQGKEEGCKYCWSFPRLKSLPAYERNGFIQTSDWYEAEFGPNCYVLKDLY